MARSGPRPATQKVVAPGVTEYRFGVPEPAPALDAADVALYPEAAIERFDNAIAVLLVYSKRSLDKPELLGPADARALAAAVNLLERAVAATRTA